MKTLLILFAIMYVIGEVFSVMAFITYRHLSTEQLNKVRGIMTINSLKVSAQYKGVSDYIRWTFVGMPFRFILSPASMIVIIIIIIETVIYNLNVL